MSSLQNRVAKPKSKKKVTLVVSCVEKFLHDGSATPAMKKTVRKDLKKLKSEFESLINKLNKLSFAGENKAEKNKLNYHMEFVENVEEIANLDPDKCKPNEADEKAKKALKSVQDSVSLSHLVPNSKVCHQEPEVLLVKEDLVGCHTQTV